MTHESVPQPQEPIYDPLQQAEQAVNAAAHDIPQMHDGATPHPLDQLAEVEQVHTTEQLVGVALNLAANLPKIVEAAQAAREKKAAEAAVLAEADQAVDRGLFNHVMGQAGKLADRRFGRGGFDPERAARNNRAMQQAKAGLGRSALTGNFARRKSLSQWNAKRLDEMRGNDVHDDTNE